MNINQKIAVLMSRNGFSQQTLADQVGVSQRSVSDWCKSSKPRKSALKKLSEVFNVSPDLLTDDSKKLPDWEPKQKVTKQFGREFSEHLKKISRDSEQAVAEQAGKETIDVLHSIDKSLKDISRSLQYLTQKENV